jgi:hypothetical protein
MGARDDPAGRAWFLKCARAMRITSPVSIGATLVALALAHSTAARADDDVRVVAPAPGRDTVQPMKPDWCEPGHEVNTGCNENCQRRTLRSAIDNDVGSGLGTDVRKVAGIACDFPDSPLVQRQVAYWRQDWINATALTEPEDRAGLKVMLDKDAKRALNDQLCATVAPTAPNESAPFARQRAISVALGCEGGFKLVARGVPWSWMTWLDRPDLPPSQIVTASFVLACTPDGADPRAANCAGDAVRLDRKQLEAEIAALHLNALGMVRALEVFGVARARAEAVGAAIAQQPKLVRVVAAARTAFDGWNAAVYQPHQALFDLAYAIEDKASAIDPNQLSATPHPIGCAPLRKALRDYLASTRPGRSTAVLAAATDAVAYPLLARLALCDAAEGRYTAANAELQVLRSQHRYRHGARWAAHWAAFDAAIDSNRAVDASAIPGIDHEDEDHVVKLAGFVADNHASSDRLSSLDEQTGTEGTARDHVIEQGKVSSVKKTKDGVLVTFKKERWM